jgi:hypothetical protein
MLITYSKIDMKLESQTVVCASVYYVLLQRVATNPNSNPTAHSAQASETRQEDQAIIRSQVHV